MLEIIRDPQGEIKAVCEYYSVNQHGEWKAPPLGDHCWINEVEVSKSERNNGCLKRFVEIITDKNPQFKFGYFWRRNKYPNRSARRYTRKQWRQLIGKEE